MYELEQNKAQAWVEFRRNPRLSQSILGCLKADFLFFSALFKIPGLSPDPRPEPGGGGGGG